MHVQHGSCAEDRLDHPCISHLAVHAAGAPPHAAAAAAAVDVAGTVDVVGTAVLAVHAPAEKVLPPTLLLRVLRVLQQGSPKTDLDYCGSSGYEHLKALTMVR